MGTLRRADRAIPIDFFLGAEGFTGTFFRLCVGRILSVPAVLCIADFTDKGAGRSFCGGNIAAGFVAAQAALSVGFAAIHLVFMLAVQGLCDTPAFLAAYMGAGSRLGFLRLGRGGGILRHAFCRVALRRMLVDALGHKGIAVLRVFMGTGDFRCPLGVAAAFVVLRVMFAQGALHWWRAAVLCACFGKCHCRQHGHDHAQADKRRKESFFHTVSSLFPALERIFSLWQMPSRESGGCRKWTQEPQSILSGSSSTISA